MTRLLERLLHLQRGDLTRGLLLFAYLFLIMSSYMVARVARDTLFLDQYKAVELAWGDIAIAVLAGFVISGYIRLGRSISLRNLLLVCLLIYSVAAAVFWWLAHFHQHRWLYPVLYVWIGIFGVLAVSQVWTLANYVLTTREAKRVFGLMGGGAIVGGAFGGKFANLVIPYFGTESLLLVMSAAVLVCAGLVILIWKQREGTALYDPAASVAVTQESPQTLHESIGLVRTSRYLISIAALILIANIVTSLAGWQFKALSQEFFPDKDVRGAFFGEFYFYAGLASLGVQLLLTSRLLRRFGLGPALFVVPVALATGSVAVLAFGTLWAAILLRGSINVLQYSVDKSSVELLYLPVAANVKVQVKAFIDSVVWRTGDGLSGFTVLLFGKYALQLDGQQMSIVTLVFILGWISAAFVARRRYVATLRESILQHRLDAERASAPVLDRSTTEILVANLHATDPKEILYALDLFQTQQEHAIHPAVRDLLKHENAEVRARALAILSEGGDLSVLPQVEGMMQDADLNVRTEALLYMSRHAHLDPLTQIQKLGDFPDFSIRSALVIFLARPGETQNLVAATFLLDGMVQETGEQGRRTRLEAARLLSRLPDHFDDQLRALLSDPDPEVTRAAIAAVGRLAKRRFVIRVLERLSDPQFAPDVTEAIVAMGHRVTGALRDHLNDPDVPIEIRREIPPILVRIGSPDAPSILEEHLLETDGALRYRVIAALNKLSRIHPHMKLDDQLVETVMAAEIMGHYRSYQILGTLGPVLDSNDPVARALKETIQHEVERIFRLLSLMFPNIDLHSAYYGVQSPERLIHDNALEFLDNVLKPQIREILVPLIDSEVSVEQRVKLANRFIGAEVHSREEAVAALVGCEDPWLKSCGAYAIGTLGLKSLEHQLDHCLDHPDPLLRETARQAKLRLSAMASSAD